jgi:hypothetical protein
VGLCGGWGGGRRVRQVRARGKTRGDRGLKSGSWAAALESHVHHGNIQIDTGRRDARGVAVHFCAVDGVQFAVHLVRYGLRVSRRHEDERRRGDCASG